MQHRLYVYASEPSPRQIHYKPTLLANLLAQRIASRYVKLKKMNPDLKNQSQQI